MGSKEIGVGTGRTSGYASFFLGFLSLFGVLAFLYPEYLTTAELRDLSAAKYS
jgi:hypothetical protein